MKIELQHRILILISIIELGGIGTKKEVLDKLVNDNYVILSERDKEILTTRPEERWRNSLAFGRQHLKEAGYLTNSSNDKWELSLEGFDYFIKLIREIDISQPFEYLSSKCLNRLEKYRIEYDIEGEEVIENRETETSYNAKRRIGQRLLRKKLLEKCTCYLCSINIKSLLICSHIKPWKDSSNIERVDINNTLLLCSLHDKLFDNGFISFDEDGRLLVSGDIQLADLDVYKLNINLRIELSERNCRYIEWHRNNIFRRSHLITL